MIKRFFYRILCGFFLGISIFAPGFSGSVIAITMGIYQDLLRIVSNPFKNFKRNIVFCLPLGIGAAISAVMFVIVFKFLFETYEKATYLLFVGLIAGNVPVIFKEIKNCGYRHRYLIGGIGAFAAALALGIFAVGLGDAASAEGISSGAGVFAFGGLAGGASALVPGMSVSMVLIISGVYSQLIFAAEALLHLDFTHLLPFALFGFFALVGLALSSRGIKIVFEKFPGFANSTVLGFMLGSLIGILVQSLSIPDVNFNWLLGGAMLAAGLGISVLFIAAGKKLAHE